MYPAHLENRFKILKSELIILVLYLSSKMETCQRSESMSLLIFLKGYLEKLFNLLNARK